ncbi:hypothetical protein BME96_06485 [Virgibacillus halodenitrificans]|uniref:Uncharacterized protein n=1 Tax=Virgibacillus halodenitrificans TaxID=1482 RepID=A0AAC9IZ83_VIRHA|nr:hypothetical protein [Virgibacillus halodenitrificans]APC47838.1 hypothetical protein BME96_06485 [Virgibacillus halodenitrificans]
MRKHFFWMLPVIVVLAGIVSLVVQNLQTATEPPEKGWSRALPIGSTMLNKFPVIRQTEEGNIIIPSYENEALVTKTFDEEFTLLEQQEVSIPITKWTQVYVKDEHVIYHDYYHIYNKDQEKIVSDVSQFYPMKDSILYIKENKLFQLNPATKESTELMKLPKNTEEISPYENEEGLFFMTEQSENNLVHATIYKVNDMQATRVVEGDLELAPGHASEQTAFAVRNNEVVLIIQAIQKSTQGSPEFFTYLAMTENSNFGENAITKLRFEDPISGSDLQEIGTVNIRFNKDIPSLVFQANGFSRTKFMGDKAFNIYTAKLKDGKVTEVHRKSNTPDVSNKPVWVDENTIAWLEASSGHKDMFISSGSQAIIEKANGISSDDWLRILGKTGGMLSISLLTFLISGIWYIWPILFIVIMHFWKSRKVQKDPSWIFFTGIAIYMLAVLLFKSQYFVPAIAAKAPAYLTFPGSAYVYIILFGIVAYVSAQSTKNTRQWAGTARISLFIGAHILMIAAVFGPYLTGF